MVLKLDDFHNVHSPHTTVKLVKTSVVLLLSGCTFHNQFSNRTVLSLHRRVANDVNGHQTTCLGGINVTSVLEMLTNTLKLVKLLCKRTSFNNYLITCRD